MLDHITRAFSFEIVKSDVIEYVWFKDYWGNVRLDETEVLSNK